MASDTKAAMQAGTAARKRLIANHQDEFKSILAEERTSRGLSPEPSKGMSPQKLRERKLKLEQQLAKIKEQLGESS
jgi:hypothetical protein